jgi:arylsulfatase
MTYLNDVTEKVENMVPLIHKWGGPKTLPHMAAILSQGGRFSGRSL